MCVITRTRNREISSCDYAEISGIAITLLISHLRGLTIRKIWIQLLCDCVQPELGLACNAVCSVLDRGLKGKRLSELGGSVLDAISELTT